MTDSQERVITARNELYESCRKLNDFIAGSIFKSLSVDEQVRLRMKLLIMNQDATILTEQIAEFYKG